MIVAVLGFAVMAMDRVGFLQGLGILIGGGIYVILMAGMRYLFLGICHNTKRTAELLAART